MKRAKKATPNRGIETAPDAQADDATGNERHAVVKMGPQATPEAGRVLVEHLFAQPDYDIPRISYAIGYKLADGHVGGDIVDVYHFDNDCVAFSIADIAGKGSRAAVHAAMIKYGLRAYASQGQTPEAVLRALDRLYLENNAFEGHDSFASVFFGMVNADRRFLTYASAGHDPVYVVYPNGEVVHLEATSPLIGVFDDQHHLFKERHVSLPEQALIVAVTDGITEARNAAGDLFGNERLVEAIVQHRASKESEIVRAVVEATDRFCDGDRRDDIAIVVGRVH